MDRIANQHLMSSSDLRRRSPKWWRSQTRAEEFGGGPAQVMVLQALAQAFSGDLLPRRPFLTESTVVEVGIVIAVSSSGASV